MDDATVKSVWMMGHRSAGKMKQLTVSDIRLGWLQRFRSVASHWSIERAAQECNVDPTVVSDSIQQLEDALCRLLVAPATSHVTATGRWFVPHAEKILSLANLSHRAPTNVSVGWLQALAAISEHKSYVGAGVSLGWTRFKVMRSISELESWIGSPLLTSGRGINFTVKGQEALRVAIEIVSILEQCRGSPNVWYPGKRSPRKVPWWIKTFGIESDGLPPRQRKHRKGGGR